MRICVNGLSVVTGGGLVNLSGLLKAIAAIDSTNEYLVLAPETRVQHFITDAPNFRIRTMHTGLGSVLGRVAWEQARLPKLLARENVDVLFSPGNIAPLRLPQRYRSVVKVQNIAPFSSIALKLEPGLKRKARLRALRQLTLGALRRADGAIFISQTSAALLGGHTRHPVVVYDGLTTSGAQWDAASARAEVAARYGLEERYVLCVADFYPHKNIETLIRGFALIPASARDRVRLVLVGRQVVPEYAERLREEIARLGVDGAVTVLAGLTHEQLEPLYAAAAVYGFPSLVESGGTTLVEAMAAGLPIVASDLEPMREFCGEAALHCAPRQPGAWTSALVLALTDAGAPGHWETPGGPRASSFRWEDAARQTIAVFEAAGSR